MLNVSVTTKVTDGHKREKPSEALSAAAHAVSSSPEITRTNQAMTCYLHERREHIRAVLS